VTWRKDHGLSARSRQIIPARADEGFQAAAIADSFESACGEPIETVFIEKCSRDVAGTDAVLGKEAVRTRRTTTIWESIRACGDKIYNGANDNARAAHSVGIGARLGGHAGGAPRSILFASVAAEEQGLLGRSTWESIRPCHREKSWWI